MQSIPFIASPNCWAGRFGAKPRYAIVHGTAGFETASEVAVYFSSTASGVSSHYVVGQDGAVIQMVSETDGAWSNGVITGPAGVSGDGVHHDPWWDSAPGWQGGQPNPNLVTISIEHVKPHDDNSDILTAPQQAASFALVNAICDRWGIPKRAADSQGGITGHFSMDPVNRSRCPGPYPWSALWTYLKQGASMIPDGWTDDGAVLTAPNGHKVVQGFRKFVLTNEWAKDNYPIEDEHGQDPLELSNLSLGSGTEQLFRWTALEWTPSHGVFVQWIGEEVQALRAEITKLKTPQPAITQKS